MSASSVRGVLLDVEGTTSSVSFVYEVLFPFAREYLEDYLRRHWDELPVVRAREQIGRDVRKAQRYFSLCRAVGSKLPAAAPHSNQPAH